MALTRAGRELAAPKRADPETKDADGVVERRTQTRLTSLLSV